MKGHLSIMGKILGSIPNPGEKREGKKQRSRGGKEWSQGESKDRGRGESKTGEEVRMRDGERGEGEARRGQGGKEKG